MVGSRKLTVSELLDISIPAADSAQERSSTAMTLRQAEVQLRQNLIGRWLAQHELDAVILTDRDSISWFTAGARCHPSVTYDWANPSLFITPTHRCVVCSTDQSQRLFREELDGLGFQVKEVPWMRPVKELLLELCERRRVASDQPFEGATHSGMQLAQLRMTLTDYDAVRLRQLAGQLSHAVEATCRQIQPGNTECEIHGHLAHRLLRHDIEPLSVHVFADSRASDFTCPRPRILRVEHSCTLLVTARSRGLHATTSRTVCFGKASEEFRERYRVATIAGATLIRFSKADEPASDLLQRAQRVYQKYGFEFDWRDAALGGHAGYVFRSFPITPTSKGRLKANSAIAWCPQVRGTVNADTLLVRQEQHELLTYLEDWPVIGVSIRDQMIDRPDILVR